MELLLEVNEGNHDETTFDRTRTLLMGPLPREDYWLLRVRLNESGQAILGFPKFGTIGIGFAQERTDWNTNLPLVATTEMIWNHIRKNKGDNMIPEEDCKEEGIDLHTGSGAHDLVHRNCVRHRRRNVGRCLMSNTRADRFAWEIVVEGFPV